MMKAYSLLALFALAGCTVTSQTVVHHTDADDASVEDDAGDDAPSEAAADDGGADAKPDSLSCAVSAPTEFASCACAPGQVCITRRDHASGGRVFLGCIAVPSTCETATCGCMGCVCAAYAQACLDVASNPSTGAVLECF